jgi:hemolysin activation/secretion protein
LQGVLFVAGQDKLVKEGLPVRAAGPTGMTASGLPLLNDPAFQAVVKPYIGQPMTLDLLNKVAHATLNYYRDHGQPFVDVTIPPQNINDGLVQVVVTNYRIGEVTASGNHYFSSASIIAASGLKPGQTLSIDGLENDLSWVNQNPFRNVNAVFKPGHQTGLTDVDLQTQDQLPLRFYMGYDNEGVPGLGQNEWDFGFNWGNAFGLGQIFSYQYTRSFSGRFTGHSVSDVIPLPWRDKLLIFGSYELQKPFIASGFDNLGRSGQASFRYVHTLPSLPWLTGDVQLGYDFKTSNSNLEFGGFQVFSDSTQIDQFVLTYDGNETDRYGQTTIENDFIGSPGGLMGSNKTIAFQQFVPGATANYVYDRLGLTRTTKLPAGITWVARVLGQMASVNLLDSEQLAGGGPDSVSGYYTSTALGSEGELINQTVYAPAFSPMGLLHLHLPVQDVAQVGVFWDYANLYQHTPIPNMQRHEDIASAGVTANYTVAKNTNVQFAMGWQLRDAPGQTKRGGFGQISLVVGY